MDILSPELLELATPEELKEYEQLLTLRLALDSPLSYAQYVSAWVTRYPYLEVLDRLLVNLVRGQLQNPRSGRVYRKLGVSMPPRHGKSTIISEHTPGWFLSSFPDKRVMLASYEADFATSWGRKVRGHIQDHPEFGIKIDPESKAAARWELASPHRGGMQSAGVGGAITGKGADLLIIDDPVKNAEEAASEVERHNAWEWALSTAFPRLEPNASMVILMTRWHEDDLLGRFLRSEPEEWFILNLPAIAGMEDPLDRLPGEALCPQRYPLEALEAIRETQGSYWWNAQYQGQPFTEGTGIFHRSDFNYWEFQQPLTGGRPSHVTLLPSKKGGDEPEYHDRKGLIRFQTVDLAASTKSSADWTVIATWDVTRSRELLLVDRIRVRAEAPDHRQLVIKTYQKFRPKWIGIENSTYGLALIQELVRLGLPIRKLIADKDKFSRALVAGTMLENGKVYFPKTAPWLEEWEHELLAFDKGTYDDQVDVLAYAAQTVHTGALAFLPRNPEKDPITLEERIWANVDKQSKKLRRQKRRGAVGDNPLGRW